MLPPTVWKYVRGGMLFGVSASDPLTVTLIALLLGAVAFAAAFTPAQQPPPANRTRSLPGLWHGDASGHHALVRGTGSGQNAWVSFGKQGVGKFSRAPKPDNLESCMNPNFPWSGSDRYPTETTETDTVRWPLAGSPYR